MRTKIYTLIILLFSCFAAHAAAPSTDRIEYLFSLLKMKQNHQATITQMVQRQTGAQSGLQDFYQEYSSFLNQTLGWDVLKGDIITMWKKSFTAEDIKGIIKFYETKVGQKTVVVVPQLMTYGQNIAMKRLANNQDKLQQLMKKLQAQVKKSN
ncbi:MAG: DUF2059 domain-containing protein [Bacteriovoracaceae bacterium]|nr:DUF2059 domain-containing protein [Bacteriovoracaceae bacterium]